MVHIVQLAAVGFCWYCRLWEESRIPRDGWADCTDEQLMVSDATVQNEGRMAGFCSTGWGLREYVIGRCNFDSHSYEAEACGILQNALSAGVSEQGQPLILGCDNISSL